MLISSIALFLASILIAGSPLLATAQQTATITTTTIPSPSPPQPLTPQLTPQEQEQQNRLQSVIAATNQNLDETEKQIGGVVYTPRWSDPVWVEPDSIAILVAYCLPGEFAESGQEILGGFELEVLESYEVALPQNFTAWMMVVGNEDRQDRLPAAVGVICASDANNAEARLVSPEEQQQINNVVQQITQVTSIDQVINIINRNNATTTTTTPPQNGNTTTTPGGTPTITATANPAIYNGVPCSSPLEFTGTITDNVGNRDVTYRFIHSTGAISPERTIHFDQPGSQTVSYTHPGIAPPSLDGWMTIEILQPVQLQSNQAETRITCTTGTTVGGITASMFANPATYEGPCPATGVIQFTGTITDNVGNRDVTYRVIASNGETSAEQTIHFDQPGSQSVSDPTKGGRPYSLPAFVSGKHWLAIEILQPVQFQSNRGEFTVTCTTPDTGGAPPPGAGTDTIAPSLSVPVDRVIPTTSPTGEELVLYDVSATDNVDGTAWLGEDNILIQDMVGGSITIVCNPPSNTELPLGDHTVQCSATDAAGNEGTASFAISVTAPPGPTLQAEDTTAPPATDEDDDEEDPAATGQGGAGGAGGTDGEPAGTTTDEGGAGAGGGGGDGAGTDGGEPPATTEGGG